MDKQPRRKPGWWREEAVIRPSLALRHLRYMMQHPRLYPEALRLRRVVEASHPLSIRRKQRGPSTTPLVYMVPPEDWALLVSYMLQRLCEDASVDTKLRIARDLRIALAGVRHEFRARMYQLHSQRMYLSGLSETRMDLRYTPWFGVRRPKESEAHEVQAGQEQQPA